MQLPFGEWLPDQPEHLNPGSTVATNVYHAQSSYKPVKGLVAYSGASNVTQNAKGAGSFRDNTNTVFTFVGTKDNIYKLTSGTFTDRGAGGLLLTTAKASCTITVTDYANIGAGKTITLRKNDNSIVVFTSTVGTASGTQFKVETNNNTTATNLKTAINAHADFTATVATNVYHAQSSYKPVKGLVAYSARLTTTNFYGGTPLTGSDIDYITFTQFGQYIIASNGVDAPQYYLMGTSTNFANLSTIVTSGTVPTFRVSGVVRDFLVTGNIASNTNRIQWSGINDLATWQSGSKQADLQDLPGSGGQIVAITSGEVGYVFRQNQIVRMDYVGGATVFRLSVISLQIEELFMDKQFAKTIDKFSFMLMMVFFKLMEINVVGIGVEKVNRFFDLDVNKAYLDRMVAAVDPFNQLAMWLYPSTSNVNNTTGICDKIIIYNYATKKWSIADTSASVIFSQFVGAYTVELMDIISTNLDSINIALDTDFWSGGQKFLGAIDNNFKASIFSGSANIAEIETSEFEPSPGGRTSITGVRPIIDAQADLTIKTRDRLANTIVESSSVSMNTTGINPVRQSGRYFRANVKIPAESIWTNAQGIDLTASQGSGLR